MNTNRLCVTLLAGAALAGCDGDISGALELLPPFDGDPATVVLPEGLSYACGQWAPAVPTVDYGLFDVLFRLDGDGPSAEDRAGILSLNGTIVHEFTVPMIRAVLQPIAVPELDANLTRSVPDARVFPVKASVAWREIPTLADTVYVESLGGVFRGYGPRYVWEGQVYVWRPMLLPDSAIALLRAYPEVLLIVPNGVACLASE